MSREGTPKNGASRTPAEEFPTIQLACFINSEKWAKRIDGISLNCSGGRALITDKMSDAPGSLLGRIVTKARPDAAREPKNAAACAPIVSASDVTGWNVQTPYSVNRCVRLSQSAHAAGGALGADEMAVGQFCVTVPEHFINGSRDFAAFDMGAAYVVCRGHKEGYVQPRITRGYRQRLQLAEISAGAGDKKYRSCHPKPLKVFALANVTLSAGGAAMDSASLLDYSDRKALEAKLDVGDIIGSVKVGMPWHKLPSARALLEAADLVVINGEGTLHHSKKRGKWLLEAANFASAKGAKVALINALWQDNKQEWGALAAPIDYVACRDSRSARDLGTALGRDVPWMGDLSMCSGPINDDAPRKGGIVVGCSVHAKITADLAAISETLGKNAQIVPVTPALKFIAPHLTGWTCPSPADFMPFALPLRP